MLLLPILPFVSSLCLRVYYRIEVDGPRPDPTGPLLLVANHPNSLLDPACVLAFAERPVRFLAKAPLFEQKDIGWLIRAAGSIPVYRKQDDPRRVNENDRTFQAAEEVLRGGGAVGVFPEGISHDEPQLAPLRTGAARIALGAAQPGHSFPIVPIGLSFPEKAIFRSPALVVRGAPISWDDLTGRPAGDAAAVRELTRRIEDGLRSVTINLEHWEDREIVLGAEAIYAAESGADPSQARRMERLRITTDHLTRLRASGSPLHVELGEGIRRHMNRLERFALTPEELVRRAPAGATEAVGTGFWSMSAVTASALALIGAVVFQVPYWLTGRVQPLFRPDNTTRRLPQAARRHHHLPHLVRVACDGRRVAGRMGGGTGRGGCPSRPGSDHAVDARHEPGSVAKSAAWMDRSGPGLRAAVHAKPTGSAGGEARARARRSGGQELIGSRTHLPIESRGTVHRGAD